MKLLDRVKYSKFKFPVQTEVIQNGIVTGYTPLARQIDLTTVHDAVLDNTEQISSNSADILTNSGSLATNNARDDTQDTTISGHTSSISDHESRITTLEGASGPTVYTTQVTGLRPAGTYVNYTVPTSLTYIGQVNQPMANPTANFYGRYTGMLQLHRTTQDVQINLYVDDVNTGLTLGRAPILIRNTTGLYTYFVINIYVENYSFLYNQIAIALGIKALTSHAIMTWYANDSFWRHICDINFDQGADNLSMVYSPEA